MIFFKTAFILSVAITASLTLSSCGSSNGEGKRLPDAVGQDISEYATASCKYKYSEGPSALAPLALDIRKTYFDKAIDFNLLKPVLAASASEVVRFAETTGVRYYKTSAYGANSCDLLGSLPWTPTDLDNEFSTASQQGGILGLYLAPDTSTLPSTRGLAAIVVRSDANKWVLTHEYMHHLFHSRVIAEAGEENDIKTQVITLGNEYDAAIAKLKGSVGPQRAALAKETSRKLEVLSLKMLSFLKQYLLEEMTIESILAEKMDAYSFTLVVKGQRLNGAAYTLSSAKKTEQILGAIESENSNFKNLYKADISNFETNRFDLIRNEFARTKVEINTLSNRAQSYLRAQGLQYNGFAQVLATAGKATGETAPTGCGHEKEAEEILRYASRFGR